MRTSTKSPKAIFTRTLALIALLAAVPGSVAAQERKPFSFEQLLGLVESGVPSPTILSTVQSDCMAFYELSPQMERTLVESGADPRLLQGLKSICRMFPEGIVQDPSRSWILIGEPGEWAHPDPQTLRVDVGNTVRLRGRAHDPSGVRRLSIDGEDVVLADDPAGGVRFDRSLSARNGMRSVEVVLYPVQGDSLRRVLPLNVIAPVAEPERPAERPANTPATQPTTTRATYNPGGIALSGLVVPGLAQFRTRNAGLGVVFLGAGGAALAAGLLSKETTVRCAANADPCPETAVLSEESSSPYLVPGVAAFVAINAVGALLGYNAAKAANRAAGTGGMGAADANASSGLALRFVPSPARDGGLNLELARFRF